MRRAIRRRAGQGDEQEQQDVVDGHHGANRGPLIADGIAHEWWDESAQQRAGDTREQSAESDHQAKGIRRPR